MKTKDLLLNLLESNKGIYLSGEEIAKKLSLSRTSIWKAIKKLQTEGYDISAISNKGYCLSNKTDILSKQGIEKYFQENNFLHLEVVPSISSTNAVVREKAVKGEEEGYTLIANEQTNGKSKMGKHFFSPCDTGVYLSILLRPKNYFSSQAVQLTAMAAVAMCETIETFQANSPKIEWIDDIFLNNKKVCGILTEAGVELESGKIEYAIVGVGINLYPPKNGFPSSIQSLAGTIFPISYQDGKNKLAAEFLINFMKYYSGKEINFMEKYRSYCKIVGQKIKVQEEEKEIKEYFVDEITDNCQLSLRDLQGNKTLLSTSQKIIKS